MSFYLNATLPPEDTGICFLRRTVKFNTPGFPGAAGTGSAPIGALPAGAMPLQVSVYVDTVFNAAGVDEIDVGVVGTLDGYATDAATLAAATGFKPNLAAGTLTGIPVAVDTIVYATYTFVGAAPTTGSMTIILPFVPKRDGVGQGNPAT